MEVLKNSSKFCLPCTQLIPDILPTHTHPRPPPPLPSSGRQEPEIQLVLNEPEGPEVQGRAFLAIRHENNSKNRVGKDMGWGVSRDQGPERHGKLTIFRPRYSQPGLTDSRKAFLWAPSENKVWPLSRGHIYAFPGPPHLRKVGNGGFLCCRGLK